MTKNYFVTLVLVFVLIGTFFSQSPVVTINGPSTMCWNMNSSATFSAFATNNPLTYFWDVYPSNVAVMSSPNSMTNTISFPNADATYMVYCQAGNNSGSQADYFFVTVHEMPEVTFSGNTSFCQGSGTNLSASPTISQGSSVIQYNWFPSTGLNTTTGPSVFANPAQTTTYVVTVTNGPCPSFTTQVVANLQGVSFSFSGNNYVCENDSIAISATSNLSGSSTLSYNWLPAFGLNTTSGQNVTAGPSATTMYTVTATDGLCWATNIMNVNVDACVGISEQDANYPYRMTVYPNPNAGHFFLKSSEATDGSLINELGQTIRQLKFIKDEDVEITNLSSGVYFVVTPRSRIKLIVIR